MREIHSRKRERREKYEATKNSTVIKNYGIGIKHLTETKTYTHGKEHNVFDRKREKEWREKIIIYQSIGAHSTSPRDLEHTLDGPLVEVGLLIGPHPSYVTNKYFLKCAEIKNNDWYLMKWNEWEIISPSLDFWILYLIYILFKRRNFFFFHNKNGLKIKLIQL